MIGQSVRSYECPFWVVCGTPTAIQITLGLGNTEELDGVEANSDREIHN